MPTEDGGVIYVRADCGTLRDAFMLGATPDWGDPEPAGRQLQHIADELLGYFAKRYGWAKLPVRGQVTGIVWDGFDVGFQFDNPEPEMEERNAD